MHTRKKHRGRRRHRDRSRGSLVLALGLVCLGAVFTAPARAQEAVARAQRYRAVTTGMEWGDHALARDLSHGLAGDSLFARKSRFLARLAGFFSADGARPSAAPPGSVTAMSGALRFTLSPDGAFSAALFPESGRGPYRPVLFGWPEAWTSRVSLSVDGEAMMLSPHARPKARGGSIVLDTREHDIEVRITLRARSHAGSSNHTGENAALWIEASAVNRSAQTRRVGLRVLLDLARGFDDAPPVRLGDRHILTRVSEFAGDQVPRTLSVGRRRFHLRGSGLMPVERVVLAPTPLALEAPFDFAVEPGASLGPDSSLVLYLEPAPLARGASRTLQVEISGRAPERDERPPVVTETWVEPVAGDARARRVLLSLENTARGVSGGALEEIRVTPNLSPGLDPIGSSLPAAGASRRAANLPPGETTQFAVLVRPTYISGAKPQVTFDIEGRAGTSHLRRTVRVAVPPPANPVIAGLVRDLRGRAVAGAEVVLYRNSRTVGRTRSDRAGRYRFTHVKPVAHRLLARSVVHREPAAKRGREDLENLLYDIVLTSRRIDNRGRAVLPEVTPGEGRDVSLAYSLTRYSLFVSVEYDAPRAYLEQIVRGMRRAAEFLYTASDGQLTYGRVVVADTAEHWMDADLYDWANSAVHPNASVAGIRHRYDPVRAPWNTAMNFGRGWARTWDTHGLYCTVVHEFGHYGLGLFDEYLGAPEGRNRGLTYPEMCRCIMGYQFSDHKICWQGNHRPYTNQGLWNHRSCWQQIEAWHEGMRSGYFIPITTPAERGGVIPPDFRSTIGRALKATIHDHQTGAFDASLQLAGPFSAGLGGVLVYVDPAGGGRTLYHGTTRGNGQLALVGLHVGDRVRGLRDGLRAQFTIRARRPDYVLSFDSEPAAHAGPPPIVGVRPERTGGRFAGVNVELLPLGRIDGTPSLLLRAVHNQEIAVQAAGDPARPRFHAFIPASAISGGRLLFECVLPGAAAGDMTVVSDAILGEFAAGLESELASFDGALRVRVPPECLAEDLPVALTSTAGPPFRSAGAVSTGRLHTLLGPDEKNPFKSPAIVVFRLDPDRNNDDLEPRRFDPKTGDFAALPTLPPARPDEIIATIDKPGTIALFEKDR